MLYTDCPEINLTVDSMTRIKNIFSWRRKCFLETSGMFVMKFSTKYAVPAIQIASFDSLVQLLFS